LFPLGFFLCTYCVNPLKEISEWISISLPKRKSETYADAASGKSREVKLLKRMLN